MKTRFVRYSPIRGLTALVVLLWALQSGMQAATFSNPAPVLILDHTNASPYPSSVVVEGVAGRITSVTTTLLGLSHAFVSDVDVMLAGPSGQPVLLMAHVGAGSSASNLDLTFDDSGATLPEMGVVVSGTYRPTQFGATPSFSPPAPAEPYGPALSSLTNLTANGTWSLFVRDDALGDNGVLTKGWSLTITTEGIPPVIAPMSSLTAEEGSTIRLPAQVSGDAPFSYQWYFNGNTPIPGGTRSALQLPDVRSTNTGAYSVVVANTFGAVTSAPAMLSVIPPVERSTAPGLLLTADAGTDLYLEYANSLTPSPNWAGLATVRMGGVFGPTSQWYFDGVAASAGQRSYRVWHDNEGSIVPGLQLYPVPAIMLRGVAGNSVWIDYINQVGPTDAWAQLATVVLANSSQFYFDTSAVGQPTRLYRAATTFKNLDFELAAGIPATPGYPASANFDQALPGWSGYCGAGQQMAVQYDYEWLDTAGIAIFDTNCVSESVTGVLHRRYCVCLYSGFEPGVQPYHDVQTWLAQTARVPPSVSSILLNYKRSRDWGDGEIQVTFNGIGISLRFVSSGLDGSSVLGGDVSQFAGPVGELRVIAPVSLSHYPSHWRNIFMLDYIRFSTTPLSPCL
ncbi:MAG TPA: immunoglobulin domain-containing protein [Verrucomicrobiae bacterium]